MDRNDLKDELLGKVAGGTQAEADAYMAELMKYYGVSTKAEAFTKMTEEQKELVYTIHLDLIKAIVNMDVEKTWELMKKAIESERKGSESE